MADKRFGDPIEVDHRFQSKVMIAFEYVHRLFFRFELCSHYQLAVADLPVFLQSPPAFYIVFPVEIVRVDERSTVKQLRFEDRIGGTCARTKREKKDNGGNSTFQVS